MDAAASRGVLRYFDRIDDPRMDRTKLHRLPDILTLTLLAVICGAEGWTDVQMFGKSKRDWLSLFLPLPNGIPSHDTLGRVFGMLDPEELEQVFIQITEHLAQHTEGQLIAIDGKTLRRSFDTASNRSAIHMVSAWCQRNHLVLGQLATDAKSNEITAIPRLLQLLDLDGAVVTLDAMGCQKDIARAIVEAGGDYVLQVKANHETLHDEVKFLFDEAIEQGWDDMPHAYHEQTDGDHGRIEQRRLWSTWDVGWFKDRKQWKGLRSFVCVEAHRTVGNETSVERRYYLSSLDGRDAEQLARATRGHWGIENQVHWSLDVSFREDDSRVRQGHAAENLSRIRRLSLNLLKNERTVKNGIKAKRLKCGWDHDYLLRVLTTRG